MSSFIVNTQYSDLYFFTFLGKRNKENVFGQKILENSICLVITLSWIILDENMTMIKIIMIIRRRCIVHFKYISTKNNYTGLAFSKNVLKRVPWCLKKSVWKKNAVRTGVVRGDLDFSTRKKNVNRNTRFNTSFNMAFLYNLPNF